LWEVVLSDVPERAAFVEDLGRRIAAEVRRHPLRVALDGRSAAGKTTLADELVRPIEALGRPVIRASIDGFHRPAAERRLRGPLSPEGYYLDTIDYAAVRAALLDPLGPGGPRRYRARVHDLAADAAYDEPERIAPDDAVLLVDGVFLLRPQIDDAWDLRVFVDVDAEHTLARGPARDAARFGSARAAEERYRLRYVPGEDLYLATDRPRERADIVVDNRRPEAPRLLG
jgi:uridine kinase